jgi:hypothetical protein
VSSSLLSGDMGYNDSVKEATIHESWALQIQKNYG